MKTFNVIVKEVWDDHELVLTAVCSSRREVIEMYGLDKPNIEYYRIFE